MQPTVHAWGCGASGGVGAHVSTDVHMGTCAPSCLWGSLQALSTKKTPFPGSHSPLLSLGSQHH